MAAAVDDAPDQPTDDKGQAAADSTVRALVKCEPYILPPDTFEGGW